MAEFTIKFDGLEKIARQFEKAPQIAEPILQKAIVGTQFILQKHNLKGNPTPWRTGFLLQSFRFQTGRLFARYYPTANYALFVHDGHTQTPGRYVPAIGKRLVKDKVAGNPFMPKILDRSQDEINAFLQEAVDLITQELTN